MGWELFRRDASEGFEMVGVDGELLTDAPLGSLPIAVEISIAGPSTLPDAMAQTEQAIEAVTARLGGRIAGTVRGATMLWTLVHLATDDQASLLSEIPLPSGASIQVAPAVDPDWTIFDRVRPVGMEAQSMDDLAIMAALHEAGDRGGVRRIEHGVSALVDDRREEFLAAVRSVGFAVRPDAGTHVHLTHDADPADITPDSWTIRQIAERHGATYDGWSCAAVGPGSERGTRTWRRWRR